MVAAMKINILDAGILQRAGHHYDYALRLARHYAAKGLDIHVYGNSRMDAETEAEFKQLGGVSKLFRVRPYRSPQVYDHYGGEIHQHRVETILTTEDLRTARDADLWIWPSLFATELEACARRRISARMIGCVHADPGVESRSVAAMLWRTAILAAKENGIKLTLASHENELRHRFAGIFPGSRFAIIPHPVEGPAPAKPRQQLKRIGFIGHQRPTKESAGKSKLLEKLVEAGYAITYQNSSDRVQSPDIPGVDVLGFVDDLAVPIAECDLVVLPYEIDFYAARGSGILAQCLALGVPAIAPVGTLPGRQIESLAVGCLSANNGDAAIYQTIEQTAANYAAYAVNAQRAAQMFCKKNGIAKFADAYLKAGK